MLEQKTFLPTYHFLSTMMEGGQAEGQRGGRGQEKKKNEEEEKEEEESSI